MSELFLMPCRHHNFHANREKSRDRIHVNPMKHIACLFAALSVSSVALADSSNIMPSPSQRISNFVFGGLNPAANITVPKQAYVNLPTISASNSAPGNHGASNHGTDVQWSSIDFSSMFACLPTDLTSQHFDPRALDELQKFIDSLNLDPAILAKLDTLLANLGDCHLDDHDMGSGDNDEDNDNDHDGDCDHDDGDKDHGDMDEDEGPVAIPEPSTYALLLAGAGLLGGTFLRRRTR